MAIGQGAELDQPVSDIVIRAAECGVVRSSNAGEIGTPTLDHDGRRVLNSDSVGSPFDKSRFANTLLGRSDLEAVRFGNEGLKLWLLDEVFEQFIQLGIIGGFVAEIDPAQE